MSVFVYNNFEFKEEDFVKYSGSCPICDSNEINSVLGLKNNQFQLLQCNNCMGISTSHYVKDNILAEYYSKYYSGSSDIIKLEGITHDNEKLFAKHIYKSLNIKSSDIKILDYGGGSGMLSYLIAKQLLNQCSNIEISIIDYSNEKVVNSENKKIQINKT